MKIIEIPAKPKEYLPVQKLKVAAYCRVSKNTEELLNSLDIQKQHYESLITSNPLWEKRRDLRGYRQRQEHKRHAVIFRRC